MKTLLIAALLTTTATLAQAATLPGGAFKGHGLWKSPKLNGKYEISSEIKGQIISSTYRLEDGSEKRWNFEMKPTENGFFEVISSGKTIGKGYCLDHVVLCHYDVKTDDLTLEETLTIQNEKLYKFGSKTQTGFSVMWQEALDK